MWYTLSFVFILLSHLEEDFFVNHKKIRFHSNGWIISYGSVSCICRISGNFPNSFGNRMGRKNILFLLLRHVIYMDLRRRLWSKWLLYGTLYMVFFGIELRLMCSHFDRIPFRLLRFGIIYVYFIDCWLFGIMKHMFLKQFLFYNEIFEWSQF